MPAWDSNAYLRRLHRATLRAVLILFGCALGALLVGFWLDDDAVWIIGGIAGAAALGYGLWLLPALLDPRRHRCYRDLAAYGDPGEVAHGLAVEIARGAPKVLGVTLGREWVLVPSFGRLDGVRPADVMWMYPKVTTTRYYGVVPVSRRHDAIILTRRREFTVAGKEKTVKELLMALHEVAPWAPVGYSDKLRALFARKERADAFRQVDARREQILAGG